MLAHLRDERIVFEHEAQEPCNLLPVHAWVLMMSLCVLVLNSLCACSHATCVLVCWYACLHLSECMHWVRARAHPKSGKDAEAAAGRGRRGGYLAVKQQARTGDGG